MRTERRHVSGGAVVCVPAPLFLRLRFWLQLASKITAEVESGSTFWSTAAVTSLCDLQHERGKLHNPAAAAAAAAHKAFSCVFFAVPVVALNCQPTINIIWVKKCRKPVSKRTLDYCHKGLIKSRNSFLPVVTVPLNTVPVIWSKMLRWIIRATAFQRS